MPLSQVTAERVGGVSASAYEQVRHLILTDQLGADEPLVEASLAAKLGVSRTPVREALRRLQADGLIERAARGMRVAERSPEEILDILRGPGCPRSCRCSLCGDEANRLGSVAAGGNP